MSADYKCPYCSKRFNTKRSFLSHLRRKHASVSRNTNWRGKKLSYSAEDLLSLLRRHSGMNECKCSCPFTGNSISILIQFVCTENEIPESTKNKACELSSEFLQKQCFIGDRRVIAAAFLYCSKFLASDFRLTQRDYAELFYCSTTGLRRYSKLINVELDINKRILREKWYGANDSIVQAR